MKHNKNIITKLIVVLFIVVTGYVCISCKSKTVSNIDLYKDETISVSNQTYKETSSYSQLSDNHVLKLTFSLNIETKKDINIKIDNPKAYGNDNLLKEEVLLDFDINDLSKTKLLSSIDINIDESSSRSIDFFLVIKDGNPSAQYKIEFNMNDIKTSLYSYERGYELNEFTYIHNPLYKSKVLADAEYDSNAYFKFKPNSTGSLKQYTTYDWTSEKVVLDSKEARIKYIEENDKRINDLKSKMEKEGATLEEIARACSNLRNQIRLDQYKDDPEGLQKLKERNLEKYGHEEGPLPDELYQKYNNSWETVLEKCFSTNAGMDACCGVYDLYFNMYVKKAY